jgi:hypothetical protein
MMQTDFKFTTDVNPDTELLAAMLQQAHQEVLDAELVAELDDASRQKLAWYRVAERAKELRA